MISGDKRKMLNSAVVMMMIQVGNDKHKFAAFIRFEIEHLGFSLTRLN
jgi:hypothetical protein